MTLAPPGPGAPDPHRGTATPEDRAPRRRWRLGWRWLAPLALGMLGSLVGLLLFTSLRTEPRPITRTDVQHAVATAVAKAAEAPARSTEVFRVILPSLVYIRTEGNEQTSEGQGIGTGVIIRDDGMVLTAHHVVQGARRIIVTFADGTESSAKLVSAMPNDLAVLQAEKGPELIVPAVLAGGATVGDETFAVGNPLGLTASLSAGVISGLNRTIPPRPNREALTNLIQFDAAVNPGNSGGPLLNREGQVIGIVTALANPNNERSFTGIGFAVPISAAGGAGTLPR